MAGHIILGVTGGVAAYKAVELASTLTRRGDRVVTVMTRAARRFVTPLQFRAVTRNLVVTSIFAETDRPEHITLTDDARGMVIAPATANTIGKLRAGLADDPVSLTAMSLSGPIVVAPAMNERMWLNPAVRENIETLRERGYRFVDPEEGPLACGAYGMGRLAAVERIVAELDRAMGA